MAIPLGSLYPITVRVLTPASQLVNAASIALTITLPDLTTITPLVTNPPSTPGIYHYDYLTTQAGRHFYVATTINPVTVTSDVFDVSTAAPQGIIGLADGRATLRLTSTAQDDDVRAKIEATTAIIERHLGQVVVRRVITEDYTLGRQAMTGRPVRVALRQGPVISLVSMQSTDGSRVWDVSGFRVDTTTGVITSLGAGGMSSWSGPLQLGSPGLWGNLSITYVAGLTVIPSHYQEAGRLILQGLWETRRGAAGVPSPGGMAGRRSAGTGQGSTAEDVAIPAAALELLGPPSWKAWAMTGR